MNPSPPYQHPFLDKSYTRVITEGTIQETVFDLHNGYAVRVRQDLTSEYYVCELLVVPQFPGASIFNSAPAAGKPPLETVSPDEVTDFINMTLESFMIPIDNVNNLKEEFND